MKIKLPLLVLLQGFFLSNLLGQLDTLNRMYTKIIFEDLELSDTKGKKKNQDEIFDLFYQSDTLMNCFGEAKEAFVANVYTSDGLLIVVTEHEIAIRKNETEAKLDFIRTYRDDRGEFLRTAKLFTTDTLLLTELAKPINFDNTSNDERLLTAKDEYWVVAEIVHHKRPIYLDTCHIQYRLCFNDKLAYQQHFAGQAACTTTIDKDTIRKEGFLRYWENEVSHSILFQTGKWKTQGNKLYLTNREENKLKSMPYAIKAENLILEYALNSKIVLRKETIR